MWKGSAAVSIRRIAQDFGVTPMALYWHVKNKDELLAAMGDRILRTSIFRTPIPTPAWRELHGLLAALVAALDQHPACTGLAQTAGAACDQRRILAERALDILRRSGFDVRQSADLLARRAAECHHAGVRSARCGDHRRRRTNGRRSSRTSARRSPDYPADRFPHLVECADALTDCDDEAAYYGAGIDLFMAGVTTLAERQAVHR